MSLSPTYMPKIKLTLSEIQRLQEAATTSPNIVEILKKFAPHIEIVVDFD